MTDTCYALLGFYRGGSAQIIPDSIFITVGPLLEEMLEDYNNAPGWSHVQIVTFDVVFKEKGKTND